MLSNPSFPHSPFPQLTSPRGFFWCKSSTSKLFIIPYCVNFLLVQDLIYLLPALLEYFWKFTNITRTDCYSSLFLGLSFTSIPHPSCSNTLGPHWHTNVPNANPLPKKQNKTSHISQSPQPHSLGMPQSGHNLPYIYHGHPYSCPCYCLTCNDSLQAFFIYSIYVLRTLYILNPSSKPSKSMKLSWTLSYYSVMFLRHLWLWLHPALASPLAKASKLQSRRSFFFIKIHTASREWRPGQLGFLLSCLLLLPYTWLYLSPKKRPGF